MTRAELAALVCRAGIACNATAKLIDVDERHGGVLLLVDPMHEADSVEAWLCKFGPAKIKWRVLGTVTGRLSSQEPNLQSIPLRTEVGKAVRDAFLSDVLVGDVDFAGIERRIVGETEKP